MITTDTLTIGELAKVEDLADAPISDLAEPGAKKLRLMIALAYVVKRREQPKLTLAEVEGMAMPEINRILGVDSDDDEPQGA